MMNNKKIFGNTLLIFVAAIWGTAFVFQRSGMEHIEPVTFSAARMSLAAVFIGAIAKIMTVKKSSDDVSGTDKDNKNTIVGGICCGAFLSIASIFQQMGIVYTTAGKAGFITTLYILIVPVISFVIFKKRSPWYVWAAIVLGVIGLDLLCLNENFTLSQGDTLICICAVLFSGHILCCDHFAKRGDPVKIASIQFMTAAVISWIASFIMETPDLDKIVSALIPIVYCGIVSGGAGYTLQMVAQKYTDPTSASLIMSLESVFAVIAGALILHERMSHRELIGCVIMFLAIILVQLPVPEKVVEK